MRIVGVLMILLGSNVTLATEWENGGIPLPARTIRIAQQSVAPTQGATAAFQLRGFYRGMTLGQFNQQSLRNFGREIKGFQFRKGGFFTTDGGDCKVAGGTQTATDEQMAALAAFPGVRMEQISGDLGAYDVRGSGAVSIIDNLLVKELSFPACVFGLDRMSTNIFEAVEALYPLPPSCRRFVPERDLESSFCYVNAELFSFVRFSSGAINFAMRDPVRWRSAAEAAGAKP